MAHNQDESSGYLPAVFGYARSIKEDLYLYDLQRSDVAQNEAVECTSRAGVTRLDLRALRGCMRLRGTVICYSQRRRFCRWHLDTLFLAASSAATITLPAAASFRLEN
jgi:hypothetical protein